MPPVFTSGMVDRQEGWGNRRMMGVTAISASHNHQHINADALLEELAATFFRASLAEPAQALMQAIDAIRTKIEEDTGARSGGASIGIAAAVLDDDHLFLAVTDPCRAMLYQDGEATHLPPSESTATETGPRIMESTLGPGDRLALLAAVGESADADFDSAESLEQAAGPSGSFIWLEVTDEPPPPDPEIALDPSQPLPPVPAEQVQAAAQMQTRVQSSWTSQSSGGPKLLQRPPGSDALHRYRSTSRGGTPSALRSRLPRGVPPARMLALLVAALLLFAVGAYFAITNRPERIYPESASPGEYSLAIADAIAAEDTDLVNALLPGAHTLLDREGGDDAESPEAVSLRLQIIAANDYLNSIVRLENPRRIGIIPESLRDADLSLIQAAGVIYLLAGDIFTIDVDERRLVALPDLVPSESSGSLFAGGGDITTLAMTSPGASYFYGDPVGGFASVFPSWPSGFGMADNDASVFRSRLYVIDLDSAEIVLIDPESGQTSLWLQRDSEILPEGPIGIAIDGEIHVLYANGDLYALKEGYVVGKTNLPLTTPLTDPRAIAYDTSNELVFIADAGVAEGRLIAWENQDDEVATYLLGPDEHGRLDSEAHEGFVEMTDLLVSEAQGVVYWIANDGIWQAELPVMPFGAIADAAANNAATPEAEDT
ncbi:MAG: hypothetical protein KF883_13740 [Thermomicrobiales bacterium]|nr:hypothetical protein [Thermomicrobiales bacterium]